MIYKCSLCTLYNINITDILGVVKSCGDLQELTSRTTGREMKKRDINLIDESNTMVHLHLTIRGERIYRNVS